MHTTHRPLRSGRRFAAAFGRAVLPVETCGPRPPSGTLLPAGIVIGISFPLPSQPVEGFSAIVDGRHRGEYLAMTDNGFGGKATSRDFLIRAYYIEPDFKSAAGGTGGVEVNGYIQFSDPNHLIGFPIVNETTAERALTGGDMACGGDGAGAVKAVEPTALVSVLVTDADDVGMTTYGPVPMSSENRGNDYYEEPPRQLCTDASPVDVVAPDDMYAYMGDGGDYLYARQWVTGETVASASERFADGMEALNRRVEGVGGDQRSPSRLVEWRDFDCPFSHRDSENAVVALRPDPGEAVVSTSGQPIEFALHEHGPTGGLAGQEPAASDGHRDGGVGPRVRLVAAAASPLGSIDCVAASSRWIGVPAGRRPQRYT